MITSEQEFQSTKDRIGYFERLLIQLHARATPEEFGMMAGGYRAELERMQAEVVHYLTRPLEELAEAA
jgi:hypothetical protein